MGTGQALRAFGGRARSALSGWEPGQWIALAALAVAILISARGFYVLTHLQVWNEGWHPLPTQTEWATSADYRDTAWLPIRDVFSGGNPYDTIAYLARHPYAWQFSYGPSQLLLFAPFALLSWPVSSAMWFTVAILAIVALAVVTVSVAHLPRRLDLVLAISAMILLLRPAISSLNLGQTSILAVLATVIALRPRASDVAVALCVALSWAKPQFGIPLTVLLLAGGRARAVGRGFVVLLCLALPPTIWLIINAGGIASFLQSIPTTIHSALTASDKYVNPDLGSMVEYLTPAWSAPVLASLTMLAVAAWVWRRHHTLELATSDADLSALAYVVAVTTVTLVFFHPNYDLLTIVPVGALVAERVVHTRSVTGTRMAFAVLTALLAVALLTGTSGFVSRDLPIFLCVALLIALCLQPRLSLRDALRHLPWRMLLIVLLAAVVYRYGTGTVLGVQQVWYSFIGGPAVIAAWIVAVSEHAALRRRLTVRSAIARATGEPEAAVGRRGSRSSSQLPR